MWLLQNEMDRKCYILAECPQRDMTKTKIVKYLTDNFLLGLHIRMVTICIHYVTHNFYIHC